MQKLLCGFLPLVVAGLIGNAAAQQANPAVRPVTQEKSQSTPADSSAAVTQKPEGKHSSPEDRERVVAIAHKLEAAPLDHSLEPDRAWAVQWVVAAPDVHVKICTTLLADLRRPRYKYRSEVVDQLLISSAAFLIEHPDLGDGVPIQSVGGMEGVLKAYKAILKTDPQATAKSLDEYLEKQKHGKLAETVKDAVKECH